MKKVLLFALITSTINFNTFASQPQPIQSSWIKPLASACAAAGIAVTMIAGKFWWDLKKPVAPKKQIISQEELFGVQANIRELENIRDLARSCQLPKEPKSVRSEIENSIKKLTCKNRCLSTKDYLLSWYQYGNYRGEFYLEIAFREGTNPEQAMERERQKYYNDGSYTAMMQSLVMAKEVYSLLDIEKKRKKEFEEANQKQQQIFDQEFQAKEKQYQTENANFTKQRNKFALATFLGASTATAGAVTLLLARRR